MPDVFEVLFYCSDMAFWFLGKNAQAANQISLNLSTMTFMFAMGLGVTAMIELGIKREKGLFSFTRIAYSIFF